MAEVNLYIRDKNAKKSSVNLALSYNNQRVKISTGISVLTKFWRPKSQLVSDSYELQNSAEINKKLREYKNLLQDIYDEYYLDDEIPVPDQLRREFYERKDKKKKNKKAKSFWDYFNDFVEYKKKELNNSAVDYDKALRKHIKAVEKKYSKPLTIDAFKNQENGLQEIFEHYLFYEVENSSGGNGFTLNTIGKQNKNLKVFLNWCFNKEIHPAFSLKHIKTYSEEVDKVFLSKEEKERLWKLNLDDEEEIIVRDLFLIGCETGLRISDFGRIKKEYFRDKKLFIYQNKASKTVVIPLSEKLEEIMEKYAYSPPQYSSKKTSDFNKTIRELCERAKINDVYVIRRKIAGKIIEENKEKHELVTSHTCRRTFCTLAYKDGVPVHLIMKISGHKTERAFLRYLKLTNEEAADEFAKYQNE